MKKVCGGVYENTKKYSERLKYFQNMLVIRESIFEDQVNLKI